VKLIAQVGNLGPIGAAQPLINGFAQNVASAWHPHACRDVAGFLGDSFFTLDHHLNSL
jgi:hypothetical protein